MSEMTVRSVLRIVAVVTMLIGVTLITSALGFLVGANRAAQGHLGAEIAFMTLVYPVIITGEGWLLYLLSAALARKIVR